MGTGKPKIIKKVLKRGEIGEKRKVWYLLGKKGPPDVGKKKKKKKGGGWWKSFVKKKGERKRG